MGLSEVSVRGLLQLSFCRVSLLSCFDVLPGLAELQCAVCISLESAYQHLSNQFSRDRRSDLFAERSSQLSVVAEWWCCSLTLPLAYMAPFLSTSLSSAFAFLSFASFLGDSRAWRTLFQLAVDASLFVGMAIQLISFAFRCLRLAAQPYTQPCQCSCR